jgi:hypothetical protein
MTDTSAVTPNESPRRSRAQAGLAPALALQIAQEAYVYLYPLILMDLTRRQFINLDPKVNPIGGPANAFVHMRAFPTAEMRAVVRPNFDTLYSSAWLDLTGGPVVVSNEDADGRYFMLPMLDMWTDVFAVPGKRTCGTGAADYALTPPGWRGELPAGLQRIKAPTPFVWIIGRTQTNGVEDYDAVHAVQDGFRITRLADWGGVAAAPQQQIDPSVDTRTEPARQVAGLSPRDYFAYGAELMKLNPPHASDWSMVARMKRIGLEPGRSFDARRLSAEVLSKAADAGRRLMQDKAPTIGRVTNGWQMNTETMGVYGNAYLKRAIVGLKGLGANQPEDAVYPLNFADGEGKPVMAQNCYVLHFERDELPPVDAFWSLTLYDAEGYQVGNPLNRFALGDRDPLTFNADGALDLYIQNQSPGAEQAANWLPAPKSGELGLTLRLYAPRPEVADGRWNPPPIRRVG